MATFRGQVPAGHRITYENGDLLDDRLENLALDASYRANSARVYREGSYNRGRRATHGHGSPPRSSQRVLATKGTLTAGKIAAELGISIDAVHSIRQGRYGRQGGARGGTSVQAGESRPDR